MRKVIVFENSARINLKLNLLRFLSILSCPKQEDEKHSSRWENLAIYYGEWESRTGISQERTC